MAGNTKLERELSVLRQKLQTTREKSAGNLNYMTVMSNSRTAEAFESELRKVRDSVGDTKRQREELSRAVNQLTLDTNATHDRLRTSSDGPTFKINPIKCPDSDWTETDLDSMHKKNSRNINTNISNSMTYEQAYRTENEPYYYQYQKNAEDLNPDEQWQAHGNIEHFLTNRKHSHFNLRIFRFLLTFQTNKK